MRTMYDDVDIVNYPDHPELVAGYVNGEWPTALGLPARFPDVRLVTIDVNGRRPDAMVLDMEWDDATPEMCPGWSLDHGLDENPVIYCSLSRVQEVLDAYAAADMPAPFFWTAHYGSGHGAHICGVGLCGLPAGASGRVVATQWAAPNGLGSPGNYDISLCAAGWPA